MNGFSLEQASANNGTSPSLHRDTFQEFLGLETFIVARGQTIELTFRLPNVCIFRFAQPSSRLHERVQHYLQVERRTADDLEHIGGRGLLLKRFAQLTQQARVFDGDDGLISEGLHERNLLIGEWLNLQPVNGDRSN